MRKSVYGSDTNTGRALSLLAHKMTQLLRPIPRSEALSWQFDQKQLNIPDTVPVSVHRAVLERMCQSLEAEREITKTMNSKMPEMFALARTENRVKSPVSIAGKVLHRLERRELTKTLTNSRAILHEIDDIVRYSYVAPSSDTLAHLIEQSSAELLESGHTCLKAKNAFVSGSSYRGFITGWITSSGEAFEVQYHSPESIALNDEAHKFYQVIRDPQNTRAVRREAIQMCIQLYDGVPHPEGIEFIKEIGGVKVKRYVGLRLPLADEVEPKLEV